ncbi:MAG: hypothetical protein CME36_16235 [unclassified Hahellaceae]|nr:hypothetical protein [Hahellaceae bacterium]
MNYDVADKEFLKFVENPMANKEHLLPLFSDLGLFDKLIFRIKPLRIFITKEKARKQFFKIVYDYITTESEAPNKLEGLNDNALAGAGIEKLINTASAFFKITTPYTHHPVEQVRTRASKSLHIQLATKIEYHLNRICEAQDSPFTVGGTFLSNPKQWITFYLSELCLLVDTGWLIVILRNNTIYIQPSDLFFKNMRRYWFSEIIEAMSDVSDSEAIRSVLATLGTNLAEIPSWKSSAIVDLMLDKVFSINSRYIVDALRGNDNYKLIRRLIAFAIAIESRLLNGFSETSRREILQFHGVEKGTLELIDFVLADSAEANAFVKIQDDSYVHGLLGFKYGARKFVGSIVSHASRKISDQNFGGILGEKFEEDYLYNYIKSCNLQRYEAWPGLQSKRGDAVQGYDVDIIFHDKIRKFYYFVQVKYKCYDLPKYFSEQYRYFTDKGFNGKGIRQLSTFKNHCFSDEIIINKLKSKGIRGVSQSNSAFLIIHNIPFLNFHEKDGIYFYEWNTFRSILNGGLQVVRMEHGVDENFVGVEGNFESPDFIIDRYFEEQKFGQTLSVDYELFRSMYCEFDVNNYSIYSKML